MNTDEARSVKRRTGPGSLSVMYQYLWGVESSSLYETLSGSHQTTSQVTGTRGKCQSNWLWVLLVLTETRPQGRSLCEGYRITVRYHSNGSIARLHFRQLTRLPSLPPSIPRGCHSLECRHVVT